MEKERFIERISAPTGIPDVMNEIIRATADTIGRLEDRIEALEKHSLTI